jgi:signal transduction histidine kinase
VPRANDEISRLAVTLNQMLSRLHASIEHERRFVADASHELRTPLALLRTEIELALRRPRPVEELRAALHSALDETDRLSRLANDLLLLARAEEGPLPLTREGIPTGALFGTVSRRFASRVFEAGRDLKVTGADATVDADADRLGQALDNLVENSLAYGAGDIELFARRSNGSIELHVADSGKGFDEEFLARAFDRFSRADHTRATSGAGLGLSIVRLIAESHGGSVAAANRPDGGADVWLRLPARDS